MSLMVDIGFKKGKAHSGAKGGRFVQWFMGMISQSLDGRNNWIGFEQKSGKIRVQAQGETRPRGG